MKILKIHKKAGQKTATISFPAELIDKEMDFILGTDDIVVDNSSQKSIEETKALFGVWKKKNIPTISEEDLYLR